MDEFQKVADAAAEDMSARQPEADRDILIWPGAKPTVESFAC